MTKKDYELIAKCFFKVREELDDFDKFKPSFVLRCLEDDLINELSLDNERFDRMKFLEACGSFLTGERDINE